MTQTQIPIRGDAQGGSGLAVAEESATFERLRSALRTAISKEHEAWSETNYWHLEEKKWESRKNELAAQIEANEARSAEQKPAT